VALDKLNGKGRGKLLEAFGTDNLRGVIERNPARGSGRTTVFTDDGELIDIQDIKKVAITESGYVAALEPCNAPSFSS
jgi:hypothetical protein